MEEGRACTLKGAIIPHVVQVSTSVNSGRRKSERRCSDKFGVSTRFNLKIFRLCAKCLLALLASTHSRLLVELIPATSRSLYATDTPGIK